MVELRQLQYFLAVAERLSITEAARDLQMAQPALSQAITKMERQLGTVLFDRSRRRLRLTAAGATLVPEARQLVGRARVLETLAGIGAEHTEDGEVTTTGMRALLARIADGEGVITGRRGPGHGRR